MTSTFSLERHEGNILVLVPTGLMAVADAETLVAALETEVRLSRKNAGRVRLLVDARDSIVQPAEVASRLGQAAMMSSNEPGDRVASLSASALARMQTNRLSHPDRHRSFIDESAALAWLME